MKKSGFFALLIASILFSGCFDTVQEITFNADGSGVVKNTSDMSSLLGLAKQMGGNDAISKMGDNPLDSSFALATLVGNSSTLSSEEKALVKEGNLHITMNMKTEKLVNTMTTPFSKPADILLITGASAKLMDEAMSKQLGEMPGMGMEEMPKRTDIEDYFTVSYSKGLLVKTLNREKYASAADDEYLKGIREASAMGIPAATTYIFNLPAPAKKVEGKNVKLSNDNKQVTIKTDIDDFFDDPAKFEFRIEY